MLTKKTAVTEDVAIWAVPKRAFEIQKEDYDGVPFRYELHTHSKPWQDGAVHVNTVPVTVHVPEGLNLIQKAVETLKAQKEEAYREYLKQIDAIDQKLEELQLLTYVPQDEGEVIENEI